MKREVPTYSFFTLRNIFLSMLSLFSILLAGPLDFIVDDYVTSTLEKNSIISIISFTLIGAHIIMIKKATIKVK